MGPVEVNPSPRKGGRSRGGHPWWVAQQPSEPPGHNHHRWPDRGLSPDRVRRTRPRTARIRPSSRRLPVIVRPPS